MKKNPKISNSGYKDNSPDRFEPNLLIPSNNITMRGVSRPIIGTDNLGNTELMMPGRDYIFPGETVTEQPLYRSGGPSPDVAAGILQSGTIYGKQLTDKQREFFANLAGTDLDGNPLEDQEYQEDQEEFRKGGDMRRIEAQGINTNDSILTHLVYIMKHGGENYLQKGGPSQSTDRVEADKKLTAQINYNTDPALIPEGISTGGYNAFNSWLNKQTIDGQPVLNNPALNTNEGRKKYTEQFINEFNTTSDYIKKFPQNKIDTNTIKAIQQYHNQTDPNVSVDGWVGSQTSRLRYPTPHVMYIKNSDADQSTKNKSGYLPVQYGNKQYVVEASTYNKGGYDLRKDFIPYDPDKHYSTLQRDASFNEVKQFMPPVAKTEVASVMKKGGDFKNLSKFFKETALMKFGGDDILPSSGTDDVVFQRQNEFKRFLQTNAISAIAEEEAKNIIYAQDMYKKFGGMMQSGGQYGPYTPYEDALQRQKNPPLYPIVEGRIGTSETETPVKYDWSMNPFGQDNTPTNPYQQQNTIMTGVQAPTVTPSASDTMDRLTYPQTNTQPNQQSTGNGFTFSGPAIAESVIAGMNSITGMLDAGERKKREEELKKKMNADSIFTPVTGSNNRGSYDVNSGAFRPDQMVPVQFKGNSFGQNGSNFYQKGGGTNNNKVAPLPKLPPIDWEARKAMYDEATRGVSQDYGGTTKTSAEVAYNFMKLMDFSPITSISDIAIDYYQGNKQDPLNYINLLPIPYLKQGTKAAQQIKRVNTFLKAADKTADVATAGYKEGGEYDLSDEEIEEIIRNGGSVEFLD